MNIVDYNDSIYRSYVKDFFKKQFNISLIDTPNAYFNMPNGTKQLFIDGKYNFDLIPSKPMQDLTFVEVETVRLKNGLFNLVIQNFNVLASKYWKYCQCKSKPGKIVYVQINDELKPTGKLAIVDSISILNNCNLSEYFVIPSMVNHTGQIAVYSIPKKGIVEYYDLNENINELKLNYKISPIIKINKDTRLKYWNKYKNYTISNEYLNNYDILRFQGYNMTFPFNECTYVYELPISSIKKHIFKLNQSTDYVLITYNNIKKLGAISIN